MNRASRSLRGSAPTERETAAIEIHIDSPPLVPPMAMMVTRAEREWIDRLRATP